MHSNMTRTRLALHSRASVNLWVDGAVHVLGLGWYYSPNPVDQLWHQQIAISSQPLHGHSQMLSSVMTIHPDMIMAVPGTPYHTTHPSHSHREHTHMGGNNLNQEVGVGQVSRKSPNIRLMHYSLLQPLSG